MGPLVASHVSHNHLAPSTGAASERKTYGGETLSTAAYIELYRSQNALPARPDRGAWKRLAKAAAAALRSGRSS